jgi:hypothetical protein
MKKNLHSWKVLTILLKLDSVIGAPFRMMGIKIVLGGSSNFYSPRMILISNFKRELQSLFLRLKPQTNGFELLRIGGVGDGGYLVPDDLEGIEACFSAGSDKVMLFESDLAQSYGIKSYILDKIEKKPVELTELQMYREGWLGTVTDGENITLQDWLRETNHHDSVDLMLQMDIEGAEYPTLLNTSTAVLESFRIIVIEFHGLDYFVNYNDFKSKYLPVFEKLLNGFDVVHFHANNCCGYWRVQDFDFPRVVEITFHRKNRRLKMLEDALTPNVLDMRNVPSRKDIQVDWNLIESQHKI